FVKEHASSDQHIDAIKLDTAKKARNKESVQLPYFVQMSCELESPFIMEGSITYENKVSGH
ncbi:3874_t:CDS:2, partial [Racocetra persica]